MRTYRAGVAGLLLGGLLGAAGLVSAADVIVGTPPFNPDPGQQFPIDILVDTAGEPLGPYHFTLTYDPSVVNVVSIAGGDGPAFSAAPTTDPASFASGSTPFAAVNKFSLTEPTGLVTVATITLQAVGGLAELSLLDIVIGELSDPLGTPLSKNVIPNSVLIGFDGALDADSDGLTNQEEVEAGTALDNADTDSDGLLDGFEVGGGLDPLDDGSVDPDQGAAGDPDGDTLTNLEEQGAGTNPTLEDTDADGLRDDAELVAGTNPTLPDTDLDGLSDGCEVDGGLDPLDDGGVDPDQGAAGDPDSDELSNEGECDAGTNPTLPDTDLDGLSDGCEVNGGLDPLDDGSVDPQQGAGGDPDADELSNLDECDAGTDPSDADSDDDTLPDGFEVSNALDPLDDGSVDPDQGADGDPDGDTHTNFEEFDIGSDPQNFRSRPVDVDVDFSAGFQMVFAPNGQAPGFSSFDLIALLEDRFVDTFEGIEGGTGPLLRTEFPVFGTPSGDDFPLSPGQGVFANMAAGTTINFRGPVLCPTIDLDAGLNIVGLSCFPAGYSAFQMLQDLGTDVDVSSIQRYDRAAGRFETATYVSGVPAGSDFPIGQDEAYLIHMKTEQVGFDALP